VLVASVRMLLALTLLTGVLYPLAVTAIAQAVFPHQAQGSLLVRDGRVVGSALIGQPFASPRHFWSRLSATTPAYNAMASAGSNLGPLNPALVASARARLAALRAEDSATTAPVPVDLVTASGSGLDPHISVASALFQVRRVAKARGLPESLLREAIRRHTTPRMLGVLGEPVVNVLELNLELDGESSRGGGTGRPVQFDADLAFRAPGGVAPGVK
jgi:K+-transporting ATPase ATPase C chain